MDDRRPHPDERAIYRSVSRRGFMGATAAATLAALAGARRCCAPRRPRRRRPPPTPSSCCGWPAAWPRPRPSIRSATRRSRPACAIDQVLSTFPAIDTAVDHIKFTAGLEQIGRVIDRGAVIRGFTAADLGFILHSRHQYHWHTGYIPPQPMAMPHIGSVISRTLGPRHPDMPAFVAIGQTVEGAGEIGTLKAFHTAGFLGAEHGPFLIVDPQDAASAVRPPKELTERALPQPAPAVSGAARRGSGPPPRRRVPARVAGPLARRRRSPAASPSAKAFDVSLEPPASRDAYGTVAVRPRLPAGASAGRRRRPLRRGHLRVHPVRLLGHARARPRARQGHEGDDRRAGARS